MTKILLVRHGETWANRRETFAGYTDAKLTEIGFLQAEKTADFVVEKYAVDKVYASDLERAFLTGKAIADRIGMDVILEKEMREIFGGLWENVEYEKLAALYPEEYGVWLNDISKSRCVEGESVVELSQRIMGTLTRIAQENDGKTVAVVSHGTPIRVAQCMMMYGNLELMNDVSWASNASVTEIEYENGEWKLVAVSQDKHLGDIRTALPDTV